MQAFIDTIKSYGDAFLQFFRDFIASVIDFIKDLPALLLEYATKLILKFLDWAASYCSSFLGGTDGSGSAISVFAEQLRSAYNALSPCVIYALTQSGIVGNLKILSFAMVVWSAFRIVSFVKSIL